MQNDLPPQLRLIFTASGCSPREARRAAWTLFDESSERAFAECVGLIVTELVSNVVHHTGRDGCLTIWRSRSDGSVRVEVRDAAAQFPVVEFDGGRGVRNRGRGLLLLEACCVHWGVVPDGDGKSVWAELVQSRSGRTLWDDISESNTPRRMVTPPRTVHRSAMSNDPLTLRRNGCVVVDEVGSDAFLGFIGEFDQPELDDIRPTLARFVMQPPQRLSVDLGGVSFLGIPMINALTAVATATRNRGGVFRTTAASRIADVLIRATGAADLMGYEPHVLKSKPRSNDDPPAT